MAVTITIVLVVGALVWCYTTRQTNETFSTMRLSNIQTACRIHKVFLPDDTNNEHPLYLLKVINRKSGESKIVGPTANKFKRNIGHKNHLHSFSEANVACMRNSRFTGFVLITPDAAIHPEHITNPNQGNQRYPALFFEAADENTSTNIDDGTYDNNSTALRQHVYKMYPQLDKCKDTHFCRFPFPSELSTINELGLTQISKKNLPKSLLAAQRYCSAIRENPKNSKLVGFTCDREGFKVLNFYECTDSSAEDYDFENKWIGLNNQQTQEHPDIVFYSYSEEPCRETVADDDYTVQLRQWTKDWESNGANIHPMLSEKDVSQRICRDNAKKGKYDYNCFLNQEDTSIVNRLLKDQFHDAANLALDDSPELDESDTYPYKIYKDMNSKLYFRQRDRCCENRIGHSGTIPEGASEPVHQLVSTGCNTDLFSDNFFNNQCNDVCKIKVNPDTPVYRKDLGMCVPEDEDKKCIPNRTVCNNEKLREQFEKDCPGKCSKICGKGQIDKDRGFKRLYHYPKSVGDDGEEIEVIGQYPKQTLNQCQARCDASGECDLFTISPCSTSSDDCWGNCTLQKRPNKNQSGDVRLSNNKIDERTRMYAKQEYDIDDPHVSDFYKRNNYCRIDGQPYYQYVMGADYTKLRQLPEWADSVTPTKYQKYPDESQTEIKKWFGQDAMFKVKDKYDSSIKLDSFYPQLLVGKDTTGDTIYFRNDASNASSDVIKRFSLLLQMNDNMTESELRKKIQDQLDDDEEVKIRTERVLPTTLKRFRCLLDMPSDNTLIDKAKIIEIMDRLDEVNIRLPIKEYFVKLLDIEHMEVQSNDNVIFENFYIQSDKIHATNNNNNNELSVVFNNMKGLSGKGQTHDVKFKVTLENDDKEEVFVDLELKPFSTKYTGVNGYRFPLNLNNSYTKLKSGSYTLSLSSKKDTPVIKLIYKKDDLTNPETDEWFYTRDNSSNLFYNHETIGKLYFENISLCFRVKKMTKDSKIENIEIPSK